MAKQNFSLRYPRHFNRTHTSSAGSLEHPSFMAFQARCSPDTEPKLHEKETVNLNGKRHGRRPCSGLNVPRRTRWAAHGIRRENRPTLLRWQPEPSPQRPDRKSHHRTTTPTKPHNHDNLKEGDQTGSRRKFDALKLAFFCRGNYFILPIR